MARNLVGKQYKDMSDGYRKRHSREDFRSTRDDQRMAGDAVTPSPSPSPSTSSSSGGGGGGNVSARRQYKNDTAGYLNLDTLDYKNATDERDQKQITRKTNQIAALNASDSLNQQELAQA